MNIAVFSSEGNVFTDCECIKGYTYKNPGTWVKSALLPVRSSVFGVAQDMCAHFYPIECLLPQVRPA